MRQFACDDQQRFASRGLVPMLLGDQQHRGPACGQDAGRVGTHSPCQHQRFKRLALLRGTHRQQGSLDAGRARQGSRLVAQPGMDFRLGGEACATRLKARGAVHGGRRREAGGYCRPIRRRCFNGRGGQYRRRGHGSCLHNNCGFHRNRRGRSTCRCGGARHFRHPGRQLHGGAGCQKNEWRRRGQPDRKPAGQCGMRDRLGKQETHGGHPLTGR